MGAAGSALRYRHNPDNPKLFFPHSNSADSTDFTNFTNSTDNRYHPTANPSTSRFSVEKLMPRAMSFLPEARYLSR